MAKRKCIVCGAEYSYCPTCAEDAQKPIWMTSFDSENCHDIWDTLCAMTCNNISEVEGVKKLRKLDLSKKDTFEPGVRKHLNTVLSANEKENEGFKFKKK